MKNRIWDCILAIFMVVFFVVPAAAPAKAANSSKAQAVKMTATTGATENWDSLVAAAKKEGIVSLYAIWRPETRVAITDAFKAKYGINVEFSSFGRGEEIVVKVQVQQRSGLYLTDVFGAGPTTFLSVLKPAGLLGPIEPMLVLPEVTDGKNWKTGRVSFLDKDKTCIAMVSKPNRNLVYNTDMIKKGEITDYYDVLKPQFKGKITMADPTVSGSGADFLIHLVANVWDLARTKDFLVQLVGRQQAVIQRDRRILIEEVARGKYSIGIGPNPDMMANLLKLGAHLDVVYFKQGVSSTSSAGMIAIPPQLAHPNATKVFINWLLSKEGQTVFSKGFGSPSLRKDVSTEGINPIFFPQPGEKIFPDSENRREVTSEVMNMAKQVLKAVNK